MAQTPNLKIPYPVGTDRVMDGDNAMQAIAERVENRMPWGVLGLTTVTANNPGLGTSPVNLDAYTVNATTAANRRTRVSFNSGAMPTVANSLLVLRLVVDGVQYQEQENIVAIVGGGQRIATEVIIPNLPAGAHTFVVAAFINQGTATILASPTRLSQQCVEDVGPVSIT